MNKQYKVRTIIIFLLFCCLYGLILINLYTIQIRQSSFFVDLGKKQYNVTITTCPERAPIFDRSGKQFLAMNKETISAFILPQKIEKTLELERFLDKHFPQALQRLHKNTTASFMYIRRRLVDSQLQAIQESKLTDIKLLKEPGRFYPVPCAGQIVGITNIDNKGLFGIELQLDTILAGKPKTFTLEKDARSGYFYFKKETTVPGKQGDPVRLSIDSDLQFLAYEELKDTIQKFNAQEGSVIIMDPKNGEILAMVNAPDFNPNKTKTISIEHTKNKIVTDCYELGSVIKVCAGLAALEENVVDPDELIDCKSCKTAYVQGRKINTWKAHGIIPFWEIIAVSNNIGIAQVALRLDDLLYDHYIRMGFGKKTGIAFPGEQSGFVNPPHQWSKQSIFSLSYGYEISATLLQLARAFAIIANNGYEVTPKLILSPREKKLTKDPKKLYSPQNIATIKKILAATTQEGTAKRAGIKGYKIMCKTGTANLLVNGHYQQNKNIYTCAGIVEKDDYQRVIVAFIKESDHKNAFASTIAAPLFERIAQKILIHDKIV